MKYKLYKPIDLTQHSFGHLLHENSRIDGFIFYWPGTISFSYCGLYWCKRHTSSTRVISKSHVLIKKFNSPKECEEWLLKEHFEWFL